MLEADLAPVSLSYDDQGRLELLVEGEGAEARQTIMSYDDLEGGRLAAVTDPLDRLWSFDRDAVGRVEVATRPDDEEIVLGYDDFGHLSTVLPPDRAEPDRVFRF